MLQESADSEPLPEPPSSSMTAGAQAPARAATAGIASVALLAYALCDLLHEAGHLVATWLPMLDARALLISTVAVQTQGEAPVVAAAGPLANLALASTLLLAGRARLPATARYFAWLFGELNLFNATGYLLFSAATGGGDVAVALGAAVPGAWRPLAAFAGIAGYAWAVRVALRALRRLVGDGVLARSQVVAACLVPYWTGAALLCAGAALNPIDPWLVLTSAAAGSLGAMAGLTLLPARLARAAAPPSPTGASLRPGTAWIVAGVVAAGVFVGLFGPGIAL